MNDDTFAKVILTIVAIGLLAGGIGLLIGVINAGTQLLSFAVLLTLQILVGLLAVGVSVSLTWWLLASTMSAVTKKFAELDDRYAAQFKRIKAKTPAWIATLLLVTQVVLLLADKSFDGNDVKTVTVSLALLIGFWIANQLMSCDEKWKRATGSIFWFVVLAYLPLSIAADRGFDIEQFVAYLASFELQAKLFFGAAALSLVVLPLLAIKIGADGK